MIGMNTIPRQIVRDSKTALEITLHNKNNNQPITVEVAQVEVRFL